MQNRKYKMNDYLTVKLEEVDEEDWRSDPSGKDYVAGYKYVWRINIYVKGEWFDRWGFSDYDYYVLEDHKGSEGDIIEKYYGEDLTKAFSKLCKDLEIWQKEKYDYTKLPLFIVFDLLEMLKEAGDPISNEVFQKEIRRGLNEGDGKTRNYLQKFFRNKLKKGIDIDPKQYRSLNDWL